MKVCVGVDLGEVREPAVVVCDLLHLRIQVAEDLIAVLQRFTEPVAQPGERLGGRGQRLVQLDGIHLLGD